MKKYILDRIERFRLVALGEGVSFLVLLGIAMPLKYIWGEPVLVEIVGMVHGLLFILYIALTVDVKLKLHWSLGKTLLAMAGSVVPFGTFWVTANMLPKSTDMEVVNKP